MQQMRFVDSSALNVMSSVCFVVCLSFICYI